MLNEASLYDKFLSSSQKHKYKENRVICSVAFQSKVWFICEFGYFGCVIRLWKLRNLVLGHDTNLIASNTKLG
jgi:hypothetical protein